jgi:hypothetical protein
MMARRAANPAGGMIIVIAVSAVLLMETPNDHPLILWTLIAAGTAAVFYAVPTDYAIRT